MMTSIKPPSKAPTHGVDGVAGSSPTGVPTAPSGPSFRERVGEVSGSARPAAAGATQGVQSTQSIVADMKAGALTPNEAVARLTDAAMQRNRVPPSMRPAVEAQVRDFLMRDPVVSELLRAAGASLQSLDK
jgi:hypothetical protein